VVDDDRNVYLAGDLATVPQKLAGQWIHNGWAIIAADE
jgi:hypothetical protein